MMKITILILLIITITYDNHKYMAILNKNNQYNEKGQKHGYWEVYHENGNLLSKGNYINGEKHGYWEVYWFNGNLWHKGSYNQGQRHGYWEEYNSSGTLFYKGNYDIGYWEYFDVNGKLQSKQYYI